MLVTISPKEVSKEVKKKGFVFDEHKGHFLKREENYLYGIKSITINLGKEQITAELYVKKLLNIDGVDVILTAVSREYVKDVSELFKVIDDFKERIDRAQPKVEEGLRKVIGNVREKFNLNPSKIEVILDFNDIYASNVKIEVGVAKKLSSREKALVLREVGVKLSVYYEFEHDIYITSTKGQLRDFIKDPARSIKREPFFFEELIHKPINVYAFEEWIDPEALIRHVKEKYELEVVDEKFVVPSSVEEKIRLIKKLEENNVLFNIGIIFNENKFDKQVFYRLLEIHPDYAYQYLFAKQNLLNENTYTEYMKEIEKYKRKKERKERRIFYSNLKSLLKESEKNPEKLNMFIKNMVVIGSFQLTKKQEKTLERMFLDFVSRYLGLENVDGSITHIKGKIGDMSVKLDFRGNKWYVEVVSKNIVDIAEFKNIEEVKEFLDKLKDSLASEQ